MKKGKEKARKVREECEKKRKGFLDLQKMPDS